MKLAVSNSNSTHVLPFLTNSSLASNSDNDDNNLSPEEYCKLIGEIYVFVSKCLEGILFYYLLFIVALFFNALFIIINFII